MQNAENVINLKTKERLLENGYDDVVYLTGYSFDTALIGVSEDGRAVYDFDLMVEWLMENEHVTYTEALEWISFNIPVGEDTPIIMNRLEDVQIKVMEE